MTEPMAEFFIELLGEEIPARMQIGGQSRLADKLGQALEEAGLGGEMFRSWSGPRRLAVSFKNIRLVQPDLTETRRGPRVDAPDQAIEGFLKGAGITRDEAELRSTPKGDFLFAVIEKKGIPATEILPQLLAEVLADFTWPKTMRWAQTRRRWVRPLHRISALFDGKPLKGAVDFGGGVKIEFGASTSGHRVFDAAEIRLSSGADYEQELKKHGVIVNRDERIRMIKESAADLVKTDGWVVEDQASASKFSELLEEVAGLVEYPHAVRGNIDDEFMDLPQEILLAVMHNHQKYFAVQKKDGSLAPHFITIANMPPDEKRDETIRIGNERVLRARLADAKFFWDKDCAMRLEDIATKERLSSITFFDSLGTMWDKTERLMILAKEIAKLLGADEQTIENAERAGRLAKADLLSQTVGEFPELQGGIGGDLAKQQDEKIDVARAISKHHQKIGKDYNSSRSISVMIILALADRLDSLVGFFHIGIIPTGSKDPYALRRAALEVMRIIVTNELKIDLKPMLMAAAQTYGYDDIPEGLMAFFQERFKVWLNFHYDVIAAVVRDDNPRAGEFFHVYRLAEALSELRRTEDGERLMAGYKRAVNILTAEEKKDGLRYDGEVDKNLLSEPAEKALFDRITAELTNYDDATDAVIEQLKDLGQLRPPIDDFFDTITVNDNDTKIRTNRLNLLGQVRILMERFADFSAIEG
jgi:glycyl-tRNA synthetase beta chain